MISKLPRWVWLGGCLLAFVGGMVNVVALLSFGRLPVSHMSGNTSELGIAITEGNAALLRKVAGISVSFLLGAMGSGALIRGESLKLGRRYSTALCLETAMLCVAINLLQHEFFAGVCLCAAACGLQNALASTYSGAIVRTTHVTGVFTDLGTILGQRVAGTPLDEKEEAKIRTDVLALPHSTTPSFLADLVRGGPTELDLLVGAVSRMGAEHGVPTPIHDFAFTAFEAATR